MFTGIIECLGKVLAIQHLNNQMRLQINVIEKASLIEEKWDYRIGDSIAVNGVCLTVERHSDNYDWFEVYASAETLKTTNLKELKVYSTVNLERALALGQRLGGHLVSGHIDTLAVIRKILPVGNSRLLHLVFDHSFSHYFTTKCSAALDGISLTVNRCGQGFLEVNIIPQTKGVTTINQWFIGYNVNLEIDMLSKYVSENLKYLNLKK